MFQDASSVNTQPALGKLNRGIDGLVTWTMYVGAGLLFVWTLFMFLDVLLRYLVHRPLGYAMDITQLVLAGLSRPLAWIRPTQKRSYLCRPVNLQYEAQSTARPIYLLGCDRHSYWSAIMVWRTTENAIHYFHKIGTVTYGGVPLFPGTQ